MQLLRLIKMVLWSFFSVRKRAGLESGLQSANPFHIIIVGIVATTASIGLMLGLVNTALQVLT